MEAAAHDPDTGIARLRQVLASSGTSLESRCDAVLTALLPEHPRDDVALVLARTRALDAGQVRVWDLAADVEMVAEARRLALAQREAWGARPPRADRECEGRRRRGGHPACRMPAECPAEGARPLTHNQFKVELLRHRRAPLTSRNQDEGPLCSA
ncbi:hypothetical protein [Streptomyces sp. V4I8]|uniref:hypothetical protein n=1 Tax=Streptomyces sp. V4I8 TaxID=3156469 RepID=UPI0035120BDD